jgi:hypothetical protein
MGLHLRHGWSRGVRQNVRGKPMTERSFEALAYNRGTFNRLSELSCCKQRERLVLTGSQGVLVLEESPVKMMRQPLRYSTSETKMCEMTYSLSRALSLAATALS